MLCRFRGIHPLDHPTLYLLSWRTTVCDDMQLISFQHGDHICLFTGTSTNR